MALMEEAVSLDPDFALGHAGRADAYLMNAGYGGVPEDSLRNVYERTREAAARALELEPELPEPHATLGWVAMVADLDWIEAENRLRRSLELNSSYAQGWDWLADVLGAQGRAAEAIRAMRRAVALDPFSSLMHRDLGGELFSARRCGEAEEHLNRALELDPEHFLAHVLLADCSLLQGDEEEALRQLSRLRRLQVLLLRGGTSAARALQDELDVSADLTPTDAYTKYRELALSALFEEMPAVRNSMQEYVLNGGRWGRLIRRESAFARVRSDSVFRAELRRLEQILGRQRRAVERQLGEER